MKESQSQNYFVKIVRATILSAALIFVPLSTSLFAQCDKLAARCEDQLVEFISDGQYYRASVKDGQEATIKITLYEGFHYRIVTCNDRPGAKVRYRVLDGSKTEVFHSMGAKDGDFWEFDLDATGNFTIKANIPNNVGTGCIVFSVGYDEETMADDVEFEEEDDPFFDDELDYDLDKEDEQQ